MEHLHTLPNSTFTLPSIHYRGTTYETIQAEDFYTSLKANVESAYSNSNEESIGRVQTLLYFGLLKKVLGPVAQEQYLKRDSDGRSVLTTKHLEHDTTTRFKTLKKLKPATKRKEILTEIYDSILEVRNIVEKPPFSSQIATILSPDFILAIQVLGSSLAYAVFRFGQDSGIMTDGDRYSQWRVFWSPKNVWASAKMLQKGWCPYEVERFSRVLSPLTQITALGLQPAASGLDHSICTAFVCEANNVKGAYVPSHTVEYATASSSGQLASCVFENSHIEEVIRILLEGGLPLIEIRRRSSGREGALELRPVRYRPGKRFVAISHVWSDGMGNKEKNEMRSCQLARIWEKARLLLRDNSQITLSSDNRVNFFVLGWAYAEHSARNLLDVGHRESLTIWMDTLCIPLGPYEMRSRAIKGMRGAYEKASKVLILDSELSCFDHTDLLESLMRIQHRSGWIRRLWTLNEGIYSQQRLFVLFRNCIIRVPHMADRLLVKDDRGQFPLFTTPVAYDVYATWLLKSRTIADALPSRRLERAFFFEDVNSLLRISAIWENVIERMTTTESDRPIIIMSLLGLDLSPVLKIPPKVEGCPERGARERMRAVYRALPEFSQRIIFQNGRRFEEYGMRWATAYCSNAAAGKGQAQRRLSKVPGRILERGLSVEYPALLVSAVEAGWELGCGLWTKYQHSDTVSALAAMVPDRGSELPEEYTNSESQIGLLLESEKELEAVIGGQADFVEAIAVSILEEGDNGIKYCRFLGRLQVSAMPATETILRGCHDAKYFSRGEVVWCVG